jgi:AraC-like DNA-binding protein
MARTPAAHDPLSTVLRAVKFTGALFFLVDASSPWGVCVPEASEFAPIILPQAQHILSYHIVLEGSGWASVPGVSAVQFAAGDVLVFPHADAYAMLSTPGQPPELDKDETLDFFRDMAAGKLPFVIKEGGGGPEQARFVCGFLGCDTRPFNPLIETLPRLLRVRSPGATNDLLDRLIDLTLAEVQQRRAGGECVRLGLSELMFVEVVRRHLETLPYDQTGWLAGLRDRRIGKVIELLHERPAHDWTLEELGREAGMSRSVLADRFTSLVGYPPIQYLTRWRMQIAARLLADNATTIAAIGAEVGYASEAAFSRTFKKIAGVPPGAWRQMQHQSKPVLF